MVYTDNNWKEFRTYLQANPNKLIRLFSELNKTVRAAEDAKNKAELAAETIKVNGILAVDFDPTLTPEADIDAKTVYIERHDAAYANFNSCTAEIAKGRGINQAERTAFKNNLQQRESFWIDKIRAIKDTHRLTKAGS